MYVWGSRRQRNKYEAVDLVLETGSCVTRGRVPPRDFWRGNFCWPTGEKKVRKNGKGLKIDENWRKIVKGKVEKLQNEERIFFFFSLLKTTKICFGSTKMEIFYREKAFYAGKKKSGKITLSPQKNFPLTPLDTDVGVENVYARGCIKLRDNIKTAIYTTSKDLNQTKSNNRRHGSPQRY